MLCNLQRWDPKRPNTIQVTEDLLFNRFAELPDTQIMSNHWSTKQAMMGGTLNAAREDTCCLLLPHEYLSKSLLVCLSQFPHLHGPRKSPWLIYPALLWGLGELSVKWKHIIHRKMWQPCKGILFKWHFLVRFGCLWRSECQLTNATLVDEMVPACISIFPFTELEMKLS